MSVKAVGRVKAERVAIEVLKRHRVTSPPIKPEALAAAEGLRWFIQICRRTPSSVLLMQYI